MLDERLHLGDVHASGDESSGTDVESRELSTITYSVGEVNPPLAPADPREEADVAGSGLEFLTAVIAPWTLRALVDGDRHDEELDRRVAQMGMGHGDNVEPKLELEVVSLHRGPHRLLAGRRRRFPHWSIEVVPNDALLRAHDPAPPPTGRGQTGTFEHPLVVGELEKIAFALVRPELVVDCRVLKTRVRE